MFFLEQTSHHERDMPGEQSALVDQGSSDITRKLRDQITLFVTTSTRTP